MVKKWQVLRVIGSKFWKKFYCGQNANKQRKFSMKGRINQCSKLLSYFKNKSHQPSATHTLITQQLSTMSQGLSTRKQIINNLRKCQVIRSIFLAIKYFQLRYVHCSLRHNDTVHLIDNRRCKHNFMHTEKTKYLCDSFIATFALLWWSRTEHTVSPRYTFTEKEFMLKYLYYRG